MIICRCNTFLFFSPLLSARKMSLKEESSVKVFGGFQKVFSHERCVLINELTHRGRVGYNKIKSRPQNTFFNFRASLKDNTFCFQGP